MSVSVLIVGGPHDGMRPQVDTEHVSITLMTPEGDAPSVTFVEARYERVEMPHAFLFYRHSDMNEDEAIAQLLSRYPSK